MRKRLVKGPLRKETFWAESQNAIPMDALAGLIPDYGVLPGWHGICAPLSVFGCSDSLFSSGGIGERTFEVYASVPILFERFKLWLMKCLETTRNE